MTETLLPTFRARPVMHWQNRRDVWLPAYTGLYVDVPDCPRVKNPERRIKAARNLRYFKKAYFPKFDDSHSRFNPEWLDLLQALAFSRGVIQKAAAGKRGIGKTMDTIIASLWMKFYRHRRYTPWICRKEPLAWDCLEREAYQIQNNELLHEDFPELCLPFVGVDVRQVRPPLAMTKGEIMLPNRTSTKAFSIGGALRGLALPDGTRPDWINLNDCIETVAGSEVETEGLEQFIENVQGLCESGGNMVTLMQVTVPQVGGVADTYTDPLKKPSWCGQRWRCLMSPPKRMDLWQIFMEFCKGIEPEGLQSSDWRRPEDVCRIIGRPFEGWHELPDGYRRALRFYAANKDAMDDGVVMIDDVRSPVYEYYTMMAQAPEFVAGEYDQHPVAKSSTIVIETKFEDLQKRLIGPEHRQVPDWREVVLFGAVDVGSHVSKGLHWCVDAFGPRGESCMIDCGITPVMDASAALINDEKVKIATLEKSLVRALTELRDHMMQGYGHVKTAEALMPQMIGIDVRGTMKNYAWQPLIVAWCNRPENRGRWIPMLGQEWRPTMMAQAQKDGIANGQWYRQEADKGGLYLRNAEYWIGQLNEAHTLAPQDASHQMMPKARIFHKGCPRVFLHHQCDFEHVSRQADDLESKVREGWQQKNKQPVDFADASAMGQNLWAIWRHQRTRRGPVMRIPAGDAERRSGGGYS